MFHTFDNYRCSVSVCIYTNKQIILVTKLNLQSYFSLLNSLKEILKSLHTSPQPTFRTMLCTLTANNTHSVSVVCRQFITSSRILPFLCENAGVSFSKSACGVITSRSISFNIRSCAFSRTTSLLSPVIQKVQIINKYMIKIYCTHPVCTVIWLWRETMLTMFQNVRGTPQIDEQLQVPTC